MAAAISKQTFTCFLFFIIVSVFGMGILIYSFQKISSVCSKPTTGPAEAEENWSLWGFISYFSNPGDSYKTDKKNKVNQFCYEGYMSAFSFILRNHLPEDICKAWHNTCNFLLDVTHWISAYFVKHFLLFFIPLLIISAVLFTLGTKRRRKFYHDSANNSSIAIFDDSMESSSSSPLKRTFLYEKTGGNICRAFIFQHVGWLSLLTVCALSLSIPWEFIYLYQKSMADKAVTIGQGFPPECNPQSQSLFESITSLLRYQFSWSYRHDPCKKYYHALLVDPLWEVTPLMVLSSVFTRCLLHPLEIVTSTLGRAVGSFFSEIPVQWQPVFVLFLMVFCLLLVLMCCRYSLHVPMILKFEPSPRLSQQEPLAQNNNNNKVVYELRRNSRKEDINSGVISSPWPTDGELRETTLSSSKPRSNRNEAVAIPFQTDVWASKPKSKQKEEVASPFQTNSGTTKKSKSFQRTQHKETDPDWTPGAGKRAVQSTATKCKQETSERKRVQKQKKAL